MVHQKNLHMYASAAEKASGSISLFVGYETRTTYDVDGNR